MKLTKEQIHYLKELGYLDNDMQQIGLAMNKNITKYELNNKNISKNDIKITREKAIEILGTEKYLSGIGRSAFHGGCSRENEKGEVVYFDSSNLFK